MTDNIQIKAGRLWKKKIRGRIADIACAGDKGPIVIAQDNSRCHLVARSGKVLKSMALSCRPLAIRAGRAGTVFAILDSRETLHGFSREGERLWKLQCKGADTLALGEEGEIITNSPPYTIRYIDAAKSTDGLEMKCLYAPASFSLVSSDPLQIAVGGKLGELGIIDESGRFLWEFNTGIQTGPVDFDPASDMLLVPAFDDGIYIYNAAGDSIGVITLQDTVSSALLASTAGGPVIAALLGENTLAITDIEGTLLWKERFQRPLAGWDISNGAKLLVAATADGEIHAFVTNLATENISAVSSDYITWDENSTGHTDSDRTSGEETAPPAVPTPREAHVFGEISLMGGLLPRGRDRLHITPSGHRIAAALPGGEALITDTAGRILVETRIDAPARILRSNSDDLFAIWNPQRLVIVNNKTNRRNQLKIDSRIRLIDCSDDLHTIAYVNAGNELVIITFEGEEIARQPLTFPSGRICVSPNGETIIIEDNQLRFMFYGRDGKLQRKHKFGGDMRLNYLLLHDNACVFAAEKGPLIIQNVQGEVVFAGKIDDGISHVYLLGEALAVVEMSGASRLIDLEGKTIWKVEPPPGNTLIRTRTGKDPVIFHARRKLLTAFEGHRKTLSALWSFRCEADIELFAASEDGEVLAAASGGRIYFVGPEPG